MNVVRDCCEQTHAPRISYQVVVFRQAETRGLLFFMYLAQKLIGQIDGKEDFRGLDGMDAVAGRTHEPFFVEVLFS